MELTTIYFHVRNFPSHSTDQRLQHFAHTAVLALLGFRTSSKLGSELGTKLPQNTTQMRRSFSYEIQTPTLGSEPGTQLPENTTRMCKSFYYELKTRLRTGYPAPPELDLDVQIFLLHHLDTHTRTGFLGGGN
jgi:hypothetical protein